MSLSSVDGHPSGLGKAVSCTYVCAKALLHFQMENGGPSWASTNLYPDLFYQTLSIDCRPGVFQGFILDLEVVIIFDQRPHKRVEHGTMSLRGERNQEYRSSQPCLKAAAIVQLGTSLVVHDNVRDGMIRMTRTIRCSHKGQGAQTEMLMGEQVSYRPGVRIGSVTRI